MISTIVEIRADQGNRCHNRPLFRLSPARACGFALGENLVEDLEVLGFAGEDVVDEVLRRQPDDAVALDGRGVVVVAAILLERESRNTYENAVYTRKLLAARGIDGPVLLVTSAAHMWRSMAVFESAGMRVIPAATDYGPGAIGLSDPRVWIPDADALHNTNGAIKEYLGMFVYRLRGQIRDGAR